MSGAAVQGRIRVEHHILDKAVYGLIGGLFLPHPILPILIGLQVSSESFFPLRKFGTLDSRLVDDSQKCSYFVI